MEWTTIDIQNEAPEEASAEAEPMLAGLTPDPRVLHAAFLADLPHLAEARAASGEMLGRAGSLAEDHLVEKTDLLPATAVAAEMGGTLAANALVLPLEGAVHEDVHLATAEGGAIRLTVEGGAEFSRVFTLPEGSELAQAGWRGGELVLALRRA